MVCLAWIFFRSPDLSTAFDMIGRCSPAARRRWSLPMVFLVVAAIGLQAVPGDFWKRAEAWLVARPVVVQGVLLGAVVVAADAAVGQEGVAPFIYFQF